MVEMKHLQLATEIAEDLPTIQTDRAKLTQVLIDLIANAVKFTPEGGHIIIRVSRRGQHRISIAVADTGVGVAPAAQEKIFEEFRQADGSAEREYGGLGLGLSLVKRLVTLMHGEVRLESFQGEGSTFSIRLPISPPATPPPK
jgi:signal transduction histidine kinase